MRRLVVVDAVLAGRPEGPEDADAVGVAAGQQGGPRGGADRLGDVEVGEAHALAWPCGRGSASSIALGAEAAEVAVAQVVGEDEDDVGRPIRGGSHRRPGHQPTRHHRSENCLHHVNGLLLS